LIGRTAARAAVDVDVRRSSAGTPDDARENDSEEDDDRGPHESVIIPRAG
jgi:hypothetical protein